jgi:hypothetical protein
VAALNASRGGGPSHHAVPKLLAASDVPPNAVAYGKNASHSETESSIGMQQLLEKSIKSGTDEEE